MLLSMLLTLVLPPQAALPEGRLTLFAGTASAVNFIVEDSRERQDDLARVNVYRAHLQGYTLPAGLVVQEVLSFEVDCAGRRTRLTGGAAFDEDGERLLTVPSLEWAAIEPNSTDDFVARVMCDGARLPETNTVQGSAAARAVARQAVQAGSDLPPG